MAERINRQSINYSDNYIDPFLMFEDDGVSWSVSSGTGTGGHVIDFPFVGDRSLLINNTDVVNDITVTNSLQNTVITAQGNYGLSFYLKKTDVLLQVSGNIKIFKNAVLLDTQTFTIGDTDVDLDENDKWVRFIGTNNYKLSINDVITFTFTINGIPGSLLTELPLYIDGLMLYQTDRNNYVCPPYVKPKLPETITLKTSIKTGAYTAVDGDVVLCDGTSGAFSVTLPPVATSNDYEIVVKKVDVSANVITIDGNASETIDGATTQDLTNQYDSMHMICDGTAWHII